MVVWKRGFLWKNVFEKLNIMKSLIKASGFDLPVNHVLGKRTVFVRKTHNSQVQYVVKHCTVKVVWKCNNCRVGRD
jgi:hypothetical protein